jgi:hypothetical protein
MGEEIGMATCEIAVVGDKGVVNWIAGASRVGEVYMTDVASMVANVILKANKVPIARLDVLDHGVGGDNDPNTEAQFGQDIVGMANFSKFEPLFIVLREFFADKAIVCLQHCDLGLNKPLVRKFAAAFGKPVYAGTGKYNPLYRVQRGEYVRCSSSGLYTVGVDRP